MKVHFFSGDSALCDTAYDSCSGLRDNVEWERFCLRGESARQAYEAEARGADVAISFLNPYVFSATALARYDRAYNIHPSTPAHPGQDPQHWTIYDGTFVSGATLHLMVPRVDAGPILDVVERKVAEDSKPAAISNLSENLALALLIRRLDDILDGSLEPNGRNWVDSPSRKRSDFIDLCSIPTDIDPAELDRRILSFHVPGYRNRLQILLHGKRFIYAGDANGESPDIE
jgi:hypothetical protein